MIYFSVGVISLNIFALILILIRSKLFNTKVYKPMLKNLVLSIVPIIIPTITIAFILFLLDNMNFNNNSLPIIYIIAFLGFLIWLLLLPNAGYLITELNFNHRDIDLHEVPLYYDIIAVLVLSMSGIINTLVNVFLMEILVGIVLSPENVYQYLSNFQFIIIVSLLYGLISLGIYIGRYLRFNSWDIIKPYRLIIKIIDHLKQHNNSLNMIVFVLSYTSFFILMQMIIIQPLIVK